MANIPQDEFHGIGGSYLLDPKTGKRTQVEKPTEPSDGGGARNSDGELLDKPHGELEPAFAAPAAPAAPEAAQPSTGARRSRSITADTDTSASN